jgi:hypothetical protein
MLMTVSTTKYFQEITMEEHGTYTVVIIDGEGEIQGVRVIIPGTRKLLGGFSYPSDILLTVCLLESQVTT